jgi:hypothetical protein
MTGLRVENLPGGGQSTSRFFGAVYLSVLHSRPVRLAIFPLAVALSSCTNIETSSALSAYDEALPVCSAVSQPLAFDGKEVLVRGLLWQDPHTVEFFGRSCHVDIGLQRAANYKENGSGARVLKRLLRFEGGRVIDVVYRGRFKVLDKITCIEATCFAYELEVSELVAAREAPAQDQIGIR